MKLYIILNVNRVITHLLKIFYFTLYSFNVLQSARVLDRWYLEGLIEQFAD